MSSSVRSRARSSLARASLRDMIDCCFRGNGVGSRVLVERLKKVR